MKKNKNRVYLVLVVAIIGGLLSLTIYTDGLTGLVTSEENEETIRIGVMLALTGEGAFWGETTRNAVELAIQQINEQGGIRGKPVQIYYEDTAGDVTTALNAYNKLTKIHRVHAIIGPNIQTEVAAIAPLAAREHMPIITPSYAHRTQRVEPKNPLLIWMNPTIQAKQKAEYVYAQGIRTVGILGTTDSWEEEVSSAFAEQFATLGGQVVVKEFIQPSATDVRTTTQKAVNAQPEAIFLGTCYQFIAYGKRSKNLDTQDRYIR